MRKSMTKLPSAQVIGDGPLAERSRRTGNTSLFAQTRTGKPSSSTLVPLDLAAGTPKCELLCTSVRSTLSMILQVALRSRHTCASPRCCPITAHNVIVSFFHTHEQGSLYYTSKRLSGPVAKEMTHSFVLVNDSRFALESSSRQPSLFAASYAYFVAVSSLGDKSSLPHRRRISLQQRSPSCMQSSTKESSTPYHRVQLLLLLVRGAGFPWMSVAPVASSPSAHNSQQATRIKAGMGCVSHNCSCRR